MQGWRYLLALITAFWPFAAHPQSSQLASVFVQPGEDGRIALNIGIARLMMLNQPASTIVIGDTNVADTSLLDDRMLILTAKRPGSTNLVVLGEDNRVIMNSVIIVELSGVREVNIRRGNNLQRYVCFDSAGCQTGTIPRLPDTMFSDDSSPQGDSPTVSPESSGAESGTDPGSFNQSPDG